MWMTVPDAFQTHMLDQDLVNYCTGQSGIGLTLPTAAQQGQSSSGGLASFAANVMTLTQAPSGTFALGQAVTANGVATGTTILALASGTLGLAGSTYTLSTTPGTIAAEAFTSSFAPTNPLVIQTLAVLTAIALEAQVVVIGSLASQGLLADPLPTGDPIANLLQHVTGHIAFEHLFLRIPGQASEYPTAWDKSIKGAHADLKRFVDGDLPIPNTFFIRGAINDTPPLQGAIERHHQPADRAFQRDWDLHGNWGGY